MVGTAQALATGRTPAELPIEQTVYQVYLEAVEEEKISLADSTFKGYSAGVNDRAGRSRQMPRRRQDIFDDAFELLKLTPTWVGPVLALTIFVLIRISLALFFPAKQSGLDVGAMLRPAGVMLSWLLPLGVLAAWIAAEIWKLKNRRLLDSRTGRDSIREVSWGEFERLVSEAYRRQGYLAEVVGTDCGDGGMDIRLTGRGETVLVQCKQWKAYKVDVKAVRELLGVVVSEKATRGIVVTSGRFTQEAIAFARQNPRLELVDGPKLDALIQSVQTGAPPRPTPPTARTSSTPPCPLCGKPMVLKIARKGQNAGSQFWGCSQFSAQGCRGTRQVVTP